MKLILASLLTIAASGPANEAPEMILVPRTSAEMIVQENLKQQGIIEQMDAIIGEQRKRINQLQSGTNCS